MRWGDQLSVLGQPPLLREGFAQARDVLRRAISWKMGCSPPKRASTALGPPSAATRSPGMPLQWGSRCARGIVAACPTAGVLVRHACPLQCGIRGIVEGLFGLLGLERSLVSTCSSGPLHETKWKPPFWALLFSRYCSRFGFLAHPLAGAAEPAHLRPRAAATVPGCAFCHGRLL